MLVLLEMWPFYQFLWTLFFIIMFLAGFWCIFMFATVVVPLWLSEGLLEYFGKVKSFNPEKIKRKRLSEQDGVEIIYSNPKGNGPFLHSHDDSHH